ADACRAGDHAVDHHAAGDDARLRHLERVAYFGAALEHFLELRIEEAGHGRLDLVDHRVDDRVEADVDAFLVRQVRRVALGPDVEADHDGVRGGGQEDV